MDALGPLQAGPGPPPSLGSLQPAPDSDEAHQAALAQLQALLDAATDRAKGSGIGAAASPAAATGAATDLPWSLSGFPAAPAADGAAALPMLGEPMSPVAQQPLGGLFDLPPLSLAAGAASLPPALQRLLSPVTPSDPPPLPLPFLLGSPGETSNGAGQASSDADGSASLLQVPAWSLADVLPATMGSLPAAPPLPGGAAPDRVATLPDGTPAIFKGRAPRRECVMHGSILACRLLLAHSPPPRAGLLRRLPPATLRFPLLPACGTGSCCRQARADHARGAADDDHLRSQRGALLDAPRGRLPAHHAVRRRGSCCAALPAVHAACALRAVHAAARAIAFQPDPPQPGSTPPCRRSSASAGACWATAA